jgi:hypothetical protein
MHRIATLLRSVAVTALAIPLGVLLPVERAGASCVAPMIELNPSDGGAGSAVTVSGGGFMAECRDTMVCDVNGPCEAPEPSPPIDTVAVVFEQDGLSEVIATAHPDASYAFVVEGRVPESASAGGATITGVGSTGVRTTPVPFSVLQRAPTPTAAGDRQALPDTGPGPAPRLLLPSVFLLGVGIAALARRIA